MYKYIILDSEAGQWIKLEEINGVKTYSHTFDQDEATVITDEYGKYLNDQPWELYSEHGMDWYNNQFSLSEVWNDEYGSQVYGDDSWEGSWDD